MAQFDCANRPHTATYGVGEIGLPSEVYPDQTAAGTHARFCLCQNLIFALQRLGRKGWQECRQEVCALGSLDPHGLCVDNGWESVQHSAQ